jgi:hypothetical protein
MINTHINAIAVLAKYLIFIGAKLQIDGEWLAQYRKGHRTRKLQKDWKLR